MGVRKAWYTFLLSVYGGGEGAQAFKFICTYLHCSVPIGQTKAVEFFFELVYYSHIIKRCL